MTMTRRAKTACSIGLAAALFAALLWLAFFWQPVPVSAPAGGVVAAPGQAAPGGAQGGDFRLSGPAGPVALSDFRGKVVVIYFGYAFCPDVCPTALAAVADAFSRLSPEEVAKVAGLFISVDPERDTRQILGDYARFFHPAIVGLTGSPDDIAKVAHQYGAYYAKQKPGAGGTYTVDHSSLTYVVGRDGKLAAMLAHGTSAEAIVGAIRSLLNQSG